MERPIGGLIRQTWAAVVLIGLGVVSGALTVRGLGSVDEQIDIGERIDEAARLLDQQRHEDAYLAAYDVLLAAPDSRSAAGIAACAAWLADYRDDAAALYDGLAQLADNDVEEAARACAPQENVFDFFELVDVEPGGAMLLAAVVSDSAAPAIEEIRAMVSAGRDFDVRLAVACSNRLAGYRVLPAQQFARIAALDPAASIPGHLTGCFDRARELEEEMTDGA